MNEDARSIGNTRVRMKISKKISRREFVEIFARAGLLSLLGYCAFRAAHKPGAGKDGARCLFPGSACASCSIYGECRSTVRNPGMDNIKP